MKGPDTLSDSIGSEIKEIEFLDLFCGGGGSGSGIISAFKLQNQKPRGTFVNHWDKAINISAFNNPSHRHFCTGVDDVTPQELFPGAIILKLLWGSPECTHHSQARGGKPVNEQSRATAQCLVRWIRHKLPDHVIVENVPEFEKWGKCRQKTDKNGRLVWVYYVGKGTDKKRLETAVDFPQCLRQRFEEHKRTWLLRLSIAGYEMALVADKKQAGRTFLKWKRKIQRMSYSVEHRVLCSADFGDPTTRRRLFVNCARVASGKKVVWPSPTHSKPARDGSVPAGLRHWVPARAILDLNNRGTSIFRRKRPLKKKSLFRIAHGVVEHGLAEFLLPQQRGGKQTKSSEEPVSTLTTTGAEALVTPDIKPIQEFILPQQTGEERTRDLERPLQTATTTSRGIGLAQGEITELLDFIVQQQGQSTAQSAEDPLSATTASTTHHYKAKPVLIKFRGTNTAVSIECPAPSVTAGATHLGLATPVIKEFKKSLREQLYQAFCIATDQTGGNGVCARGLDKPTYTLVTKNNQGVVSFEVTHIDIGPVGANEEKSVIAELVPLDAFRMDTAHQGSDEQRVADLLTPLQTVCGNRSGVGVVRSFIARFYNQGGQILRDDKSPTCINKDRPIHCLPVLEIKDEFFVLDIFFRMLTVRELARAQGFSDDYQFPGTKTDAVRAIGNAVSCGIARALVLAATTQDPEIVKYIKFVDNLPPAA